MNKIITALVLFSLTSLCFTDGYVPSKLEEVIGEFESIFVVKIIAIEQENKITEQGGVSTYIHVTFQLKEILKGKNQKLNKATFILPSYYGFISDSNGEKVRFSKWLKIKGSGVEMELGKNKQYIVYFTKDGLNPGDGNFRFDRADNILKKNEVLELLKNPKEQINDRVTKK
jgi:hypothetical protein